ncbi:hypothetical protein G5I_13530 [Acromyrmex echinatior]|uniref:ascorbate ferrireductase (transmembrane) n=1 Tax=Acromyrmex echinatior TaxID=103372 RepID=F4X5A2_ACREC|nr:hypothetical protein G5I_13530 [Acromyrmex echinatior]
MNSKVHKTLALAMDENTAYVLLMSEATLILASDNMLTASLSRRVNKHLHWILQAIGLILTLVGVGVKYNVKSVHFLSIHSITGISSLVIICIVTLLGYPVWIAWKLRKFVRPMIIKFFHNFLATIGFIIGMISQCYGYKKAWVYEVEMKHADDMLLILTILITILSLRETLSMCQWARRNARRLDWVSIQGTLLMSCCPCFKSRIKKEKLSIYSDAKGLLYNILNVIMKIRFLPRARRLHMDEVRISSGGQICQKIPNLSYLLGTSPRDCQMYPFDRLIINH